MPKIAEIPRLKTRLLFLWDNKLISDAHFNSAVDSLEKLEYKEYKRVNSIAKRENDRLLAGNEISYEKWFINWQVICAAREAFR